jgi:4-hydroxy-4-methyl-2-oxoglutarate aldolase
MAIQRRIRLTANPCPPCPGQPGADHFDDARRYVEAAGLSAGTIHEVMGRLGLMGPYIRPIYPTAKLCATAKLCGTAVTVLLCPGDWMRHVATEQLEPGDVVVLAACSAECEGTFLGELLAASVRALGGVGLVIDGGCRDVAALEEMNFPSSGGRSTPRARSRSIWARSPSPSSVPTRSSTPARWSLPTIDGLVVVRRMCGRNRRGGPPTRGQWGEGNASASPSARSASTSTRYARRSRPPA